MAAQAQALAGIGALVTRAPAQATSLIAGLEALGADVMHLPVLAIEAVDAQRDFDLYCAAFGVAAILGEMHGVGVVWTSANAVKYGLPQLNDGHQTALQSGEWWSACVGDATAAALASHGIQPRFCAPRATAASLADMLCEHLPMSEHVVLFPCSAKARSVLPERLREAGAHVVPLVVYQPIPADVSVVPVCEAIAAGRLHLLTFASPSTLQFFLELMGEAGQALLAEHSANLHWAAIGETTAAALVKRGLAPVIVAEPPGVPGLLAAAAAHFAP